VNSVRDEIRLPINETIPSFDVTVEVDLNAPVSAVSAHGDETELTWTSTDNTLSIALSRVSYHVLLVIE
ncbi:MAG: hypothetical protein OXG53_01795, partial [Chloroflexi bacterium]|nr:hypothetical protein [Chloroflexota bacterium]